MVKGILDLQFSQANMGVEPPFLYVGLDISTHPRVPL